MSRRVLFVCDDPESDSSWIYLLRRASMKVDAVRTRKEALERLKERTFDLALINASGSGADWVEFFRQLRDDFANPILLMTVGGEEAFALQAYRAGVDDFITIPVSNALYVAKVRSWLRRAASPRAAAPQPVEAGRLVLDPAERKLALPDKSSVELTNLESKVLQVLMEHPGQVIAPSEIVASVWSYDEGEGHASLKNIVYRLRRKIEPDPNRPRYIRSSMGEGYLFQSP